MQTMTNNLDRMYFISVRCVNMKSDGNWNLLYNIFLYNCLDLRFVTICLSSEVLWLCWEHDGRLSYRCNSKSYSVVHIQQWTRTKSKIIQYIVTCIYSVVNIPLSIFFTQLCTVVKDKKQETDEKRFCFA